MLKTKESTDDKESRRNLSHSTRDRMSQICVRDFFNSGCTVMAWEPNALVLLTKLSSLFDSGVVMNQARLPFDPRRRLGDFPPR